MFPLTIVRHIKVDREETLAKNMAKVDRNLINTHDAHVFEHLMLFTDESRSTIIYLKT